MPFKVKYEKPKKKTKKLTESQVTRERYQYTKKAMNVVLLIFFCIAISSCYINLKNGFSMDTIYTESASLMWKCIGFYCLKSVTETYLKKKSEIEEMQYNYINEDNKGDDI